MRDGFLIVLASVLTACGPDGSAPEEQRAQTTVWILVDGFLAEGFTAGAPQLAEALGAESDTAARIPSTSLTASCASYLTGLRPPDHGLLSAKDLRAHRLSESVPTIPERLANAGVRCFVSVARPQLTHRVAGLWRGVAEDDRLEPDSRSARVARTPREVFEVLAERVSELEEDREWLLILQVSCPEFPGGTTPMGALDALRSRADGLTAEARAEVELVLGEAPGLAGFEQAVERFGRRRGSEIALALGNASRDAWLGEFARGFDSLRMTLSSLGRGESATWHLTGLRGAEPAELDPTELSKYNALRFAPRFVAAREGTAWEPPRFTETWGAEVEVWSGFHGEMFMFLHPPTIGYRLGVPDLDEHVRLQVRADQPVLFDCVGIRLARQTLELESGPARHVFVPTSRRGVELELKLLDPVGAAHGGRAPEPQPDPLELGFALEPVGPPLVPHPDPELERFLRSLPDGE